MNLKFYKVELNVFLFRGRVGEAVAGSKRQMSLGVKSVHFVWHTLSSETPQYAAIHTNDQNIRIPVIHSKTLR
jgi:hypothetical protein